MPARTLVRKLGLRTSTELVLLDAPASFPEALGPLPEQVVVISELEAASTPLRFVLLFAEEEIRLRHRMASILPRLAPDGALWIAWPKKASKRPTDLSFSVVQQAGLAAGLVDNKVCAIDAVWSGLRLVVPRARRPTWPA